MDLEKVVNEGRSYLRNAQDALDRTVQSEEELYVWENQVEVIDQFLANTEDLDGDGDLEEVRKELWEVKRKLEKKAMAFLGEGEVPEPTEEEMVEGIVAFAEEFLPDVEDSLSVSADEAPSADVWETPLATINSLLADSEPYKDNADLGPVRDQLKERKAQLEARLDEFVERLHAEGEAAGDGGDGDE